MAPNTGAHCYSRALLVTLFFAAFRSGNAGSVSGLCYPPADFLQHIICLAASCILPARIGKPTSTTKRNLQWKIGAAPFRRAHGISLNGNSEITGCGKPQERACPGI